MPRSLAAIRSLRSGTAAPARVADAGLGQHRAHVVVDRVLGQHQRPRHRPRVGAGGEVAEHLALARAEPVRQREHLAPFGRRARLDRDRDSPPPVIRSARSVTQRPAPRCTRDQGGPTGTPASAASSAAPTLSAAAGIGSAIGSSPGGFSSQQGRARGGGLAHHAGGSPPSSTTAGPASSTRSASSTKVRACAGPDALGERHRRARRAARPRRLGEGPLARQRSSQAQQPNRSANTVDATSRDAHAVEHLAPQRRARQARPRSPRAATRPGPGPPQLGPAVDRGQVALPDRARAAAATAASVRRPAATCRRR